MNNLNNIPKHWQIKKLGEVCEVLDNLRKPINSTERNQRIHGKKELYPYYGATGQVGWIDSYLTDEDLVLIGEDGAPFLDNYKDKAYKIKGKSWVNNHAHILKPKQNQVADEFILYYLNSINYREFVNGTTRLKLTKSSLVEIPVILPPLPEQHLIVSRIEELFSELENGKKQLQTALQQLKVYRQSLLSILVSGENCKTIESVIEKLDQGWSPKCLNKSSENDQEWAVIKTSAIQHGHFLPDENKVLPEDLKPRMQHELMVGDVLITRAGPRVRVGVCCMVKSTRQRLINCDKVYRVKVNRKVITPEFFEFILNTPFYLREIEKMKSGISDSGLNLTQLKFLKIEIPVPPIAQQQLIVSELESKLTICDKIEQTINESLQQAETLRQSILKMAFEGRLVKYSQVSEYINSIELKMVAEPEPKY
ncbi:MAG TPA: restriction endonuclease subunit S [Bacteroidales bacterium]|nr:restriction endonuclease subunit S [Bacteroidales bacterium]